MESIAALSNTLFGRLQNWLPNFLQSSPENFAQPLLNEGEILDLRLRVISQKTQPRDKYDTAHQRMGDTRAIHRGYGLDYEESRPYQPGDEPRYINWPLAARTGELYMKVFRGERRPGFFLLVHRRQTMRSETRSRLQDTQAATVATDLTLVALQRQAAGHGAVLDTNQQSPQ